MTDHPDNGARPRFSIVSAVYNVAPYLPDFIASTLATGFGWAPFAPITKDQWLMLQRDNVVAAGAANLAELGITPTPLATVAEGWLVQYRRNGRFAELAAR